MEKCNTSIRTARYKSLTDVSLPEKVNQLPRKQLKISISGLQELNTVRCLRRNIKMQTLGRVV